jgi:hypothetical protein
VGYLKKGNREEGRRQRQPSGESLAQVCATNASM